jgi:hypothetical protein
MKEQGRHGTRPAWRLARGGSWLAVMWLETLPLVNSGNWKLENRNWKLENRKPKLENGNQKFKIQNRHETAAATNR